MDHQGRPSRANPRPNGSAELLRTTETVRCGQHRRRSGGELGAALAAASREDGTAGAGAHAKAEAVGLRATAVVRLEGALAHGGSPRTSGGASPATPGIAVVHVCCSGTRVVLTTQPGHARRKMSARARQESPERLSHATSRRGNGSNSRRRAPAAVDRRPHTSALRADVESSPPRPGVRATDSFPHLGTTARGRRRHHPHALWVSPSSQVRALRPVPV